MVRLVIIFSLLIGLFMPASAQTTDLQSLLQQHQKAVERASRKTLAPIIQALNSSDLRSVPQFLKKWQAKEVYVRKSDGLFFYVENPKADPILLLDISSSEPIAEVSKGEIKQLKPNSGVRSVIASALVRFQLIDQDAAVRTTALTAIERDPKKTHLELLRSVAPTEPVQSLQARMQRLERLLTIGLDDDTSRRVKAIESFAGDTNVDVRAALNPVLATTIGAAPVLPDNINLARKLRIGDDLEPNKAFELLVKNGFAKPGVSVEARDSSLVENIVDGKVSGIDVQALDNEAARIEAYQLLAKAGKVPPFVTSEQQAESLAAHVFYESYKEADQLVTQAAHKTLDSINTRVSLYGMADLGLDGLSLASIYFLAAIGLAITFGVMGVINMAHGEFIMIGAYTGYVVQLFIPDYTISILLALPLAFAVTFFAGVAMERLVIRHLMHRPLETLLATFGISIALQQLAKNIFGTQARPLTSPAWLDGAWVINDVISISYIRIAIFFLALIFLVLLLFILNRTRLGLEVRAVTQNPRMASSMGINPDRINMLAFGLGSGIAGIAGVAIGLFAQVTSELGSGYIVQSFMTVVVGGVGNIWGTLAGAGMIGGLQKIIEFFNPSNTLAAQTYMIVFIIIFIQFKPKGIIALKGRAAGD